MNKKISSIFRFYVIIKNELFLLNLEMALDTTFEMRFALVCQTTCRGPRSIWMLFYVPTCLLHKLTRILIKTMPNNANVICERAACTFLISMLLEKQMASLFFLNSKRNPKEFQILQKNS